MEMSNGLKKAAVSLILTGVLLGTASCAKKASFTEKSDVTLSDYNEHKVEMTVDVVRSRKINVTFDNKGEATYIYGRIYSLEINKNGEWYKVSFEPGRDVFTDEGILIGPAEEYAKKDQEGMSLSPVSTEPVYLDSFGKLPEGHYRIVKTISVMDGGKNYVLSAEFDLAKESNKSEELEKSRIPEDKIVSEKDYALPISSVNKTGAKEVTFQFTKYSTFGVFYLQYKKDGVWYDMPIRNRGGSASSIPADDVLTLYMEDNLNKGTYRLLHDRSEILAGEASYYAYTFELS